MIARLRFLEWPAVDIITNYFINNRFFSNKLIGYKIFLTHVSSRKLLIFKQMQVSLAIKYFKLTPLPAEDTSCMMIRPVVEVAMTHSR